MKKLLLISAMVLGGLGIKTADAQLGIRINLHLGTRPVYVAPQPVYDDYYYLPEVEAYYSVAENCYYYQDGDSWISAAFLPGRYHDFDWRTAKRYEIHENRPFMHHDVYRGKFGGYANRSDFYARTYPNHDHFNNNRGGHNQYDNQSSGSYNNRHDSRNQNGYSQPAPGRNQGSYNQPAQSQGQQGDRGNDQASRGQRQSQGGGSTQPANHTGNHDRGNAGNEHFAANKMGVTNDRGAMSRPTRF